MMRMFLGITIGLIIVIYLGIQVYQLGYTPVLTLNNKDTYEINKNGLVVNGELQSFASMDSYKVETENVDPPKLLLKSRKLLQPLIAIYLDGVDADEISNYLAYFLPEEDLHEPVSHKIMEYLGF
jgi:hypothetical protein